MQTPEEIALLFKAALPIDDIHELLIPGSPLAVIWVDIGERPDLQVLKLPEDTLGNGYSVCTWAYERPGSQQMRIGLRIEMHQPARFVVALAFPVRKYLEQLKTISEGGHLWIVPGPPPAHLTGRIEMDAQMFMAQVYAYSGQGLLTTLQDHLVEELRQQLAEWQRPK